MYKDYLENLFEILAVVIILSLISSSPTIPRKAYDSPRRKGGSNLRWFSKRRDHCRPRSGAANVWCNRPFTPSCAKYRPHSSWLQGCRGPKQQCLRVVLSSGPDGQLTLAPEWRLLLLLLIKKKCSSFVWNTQGAVFYRLNPKP